jgi:hypothetical protein
MTALFDFFLIPAISLFLFPVSLTVSLLRDLKHSNVVTLHDIVHMENSLTLVFEYLVS